MTENKNTFMTTSQTAKYLGISKKTLMRWDEEDTFASREGIGNIRVYWREDVKKAKEWLDLREKHLKHIRKLKPIREAVNKTLVANPLIPGEPIKHFWRLENIANPFKRLRKWEEEERKIQKGYSKFNNFEYKKIERVVK